jgi:hypothetical protein
MQIAIIGSGRVCQERTALDLIASIHGGLTMATITSPSTPIAEPALDFDVSN